MSQLNGAANSPAITPVPHFELRPIENNRAALMEWWPRIMPEVWKIIEAAPEICDFEPEEVFIFLRRKVAFLYIGFLDGEYAGFGILRIMNMPFSQERYLLSWLGAGFNTEAVDLYFAELDNIARRAKLSKVRHEGRVGWQRRLPGPGWRTISVIQERRLD